MEHVCTRCARSSLRARYIAPPAVRMMAPKTFSTSTPARSNKDNDLPATFRSIVLPGRARVGSKNSNRPQSSPLPRRVPPSSPNAQPVQARAPQPPQRQPAQSGAPQLPQRQPAQPGASQGSTQVVRPRQLPGVLRQTGAGTGRLQAGRIQDGKFRRIPNADAPLKGRGGKPKTDRRMAMSRGKGKEDKESEQDAATEDIDELVDDYVAKVIDRPVNPTEPIEYVPGENMSIEDLRKDWPNIPLSSTGLTESVQQRIESLAHRLPHGYQTPMQLVERYRKGKLTRFESEEEKETVLKLAAEVQQQKADEIVEKKGTEVKAKDMSFVDLSSRSDERNALADAYVKGTYPALEKQRMPFLDQIARNLRNNYTYNAMQSEEFMKAIAGTTGSQAQQQQRAK